MSEPPPFPGLVLRVVADVTEGSKPDVGFLRVRRRRLVVTNEDGTESRVFPYDDVWREALDAVVIAAHWVDATGTRRVILRSSVRPPIGLRDPALWPSDRPQPGGQLWEVPAGLVEKDERTSTGLRVAAARELEEETGLHAPPETLAELGNPAFPSGGMSGECLFFFHVEVAGPPTATPSEDGSPLEHGAAFWHPTLIEALAHGRAHGYPDMKTELALRRLAELFP